jgi:hypothetical protein
MTQQEREAAIRSLRRTARDARANRDLSVAMQLERIADEHEQALGRRVI